MSVTDSLRGGCTNDEGKFEKKNLVLGYAVRINAASLLEQ